MATRETRSSVSKQVGESKVLDKATDVPEVKKENCKHSDSAFDIELKKPISRARTRKTTESIDDSSQERYSPHSRSTRFRSASLPPVSREPHSPKGQRKLRTVKVCQQQNGVKNHVSPYRTRSDTPVHILRSGKQRSSILGWVFDDRQIPLEYRRRRTSSVVKDKIQDDDTLSVSSKVHSSRDLESDISTCNSPVQDLSKIGVGDFDNDIKMPGLCSPDIKTEEGFVQETRSEGDQTEITSDSNLGKTISNKISALIKRGRVSAILQQISRAREERRAQAAESSGDVHKENSGRTNLKDTNSNFCAALDSNTSGNHTGRYRLNPLSKASSTSDTNLAIGKAKESVMSRDSFAPSLFYKKDVKKEVDMKTDTIQLKSTGKLILVNSVMELSRDLKKNSQSDPVKTVKQEVINTSNSGDTERAGSSSVSVKKETNKIDTFDEVLQRLEKCVTESERLGNLNSLKSANTARRSVDKGNLLGTSIRDRGVISDVSVKEEPNTSSRMNSPVPCSKLVKVEPKIEPVETQDSAMTSGSDMEVCVHVKSEIEDSNTTENVPNSAVPIVEPKSEPQNDESESGDFVDDVKSKVRRSVRSSAHKATALLSARSNKPKSKSQSHVTDDEASNSGNISESCSVSLPEAGSNLSKMKPKTALKSKKRNSDTECGVLENNVVVKTEETSQNNEKIDAEPVTSSEKSEKVPKQCKVDKPVTSVIEVMDGNNKMVVENSKAHSGSTVQKNQETQKRAPENKKSKVIVKDKMPATHGASNSRVALKETKNTPKKSLVVGKEKDVRKTNVKEEKKEVEKKTELERKKQEEVKKMKEKKEQLIKGAEEKKEEQLKERKEQPKERKELPKDRKEQSKERKEQSKEKKEQSKEKKEQPKEKKEIKNKEEEKVPKKKAENSSSAKIKGEEEKREEVNEKQVDGRTEDGRGKRKKLQTKEMLEREKEKKSTQKGDNDEKEEDGRKRKLQEESKRVDELKLDNLEKMECIRGKTNEKIVKKQAEENKKKVVDEQQNKIKEVDAVCGETVENKEKRITEDRLEKVEKEQKGIEKDQNRNKSGLVLEKENGVSRKEKEKENAVLENPLEEGQKANEVKADDVMEKKLKLEEMKTKENNKAENSKDEGKKTENVKQKENKKNKKDDVRIDREVDMKKDKEDNVKKDKEDNVKKDKEDNVKNDKEDNVKKDKEVDEKRDKDDDVKKDKNDDVKKGKDDLKNYKEDDVKRKDDKDVEDVKETEETELRNNVVDAVQKDKEERSKVEEAILKDQEEGGNVEAENEETNEVVKKVVDVRKNEELKIVDAAGKESQKEVQNVIEREEKQVDENRSTILDNEESKELGIEDNKIEKGKEEKEENNEIMKRKRKEGNDLTESNELKEAAALKKAKAGSEGSAGKESSAEIMSRENLCASAPSSSTDNEEKLLEEHKVSNDTLCKEVVSEKSNVTEELHDTSVTDTVKDKVKNASIPPPPPLLPVEEVFKSRRLSSEQGRDKNENLEKNSLPKMEPVGVKSTENRLIVVPFQDKSAVKDAATLVSKHSESTADHCSEERPVKRLMKKRKLSESLQGASPSKLMRNDNSRDLSIIHLPVLSAMVGAKEYERITGSEGGSTVPVCGKTMDFEESKGSNDESYSKDNKHPSGANDDVCIDIESLADPCPLEFNKDIDQQPSTDADVNLEDEPEFVGLEKIEENGSMISGQKIVMKLSESSDSSDKQSDDESEPAIVEVIDSEDSSKESLDMRADSKGMLSEGEGEDLSPKDVRDNKAFAEDGNEYEVLEKEEDEGISDTVVSKPDNVAAVSMQEGMCAEKTPSSSGVSTDELSPEDSAVKEPFLSALGLGPRAKVLDGREHAYTGTLKTVIKVHRSPEKRGSKFRFIVKNRTSGTANGFDGRDKSQGSDDGSGPSSERVEYRIHREGSSTLDPAAADLPNFGIGNHLSTNSPFLKETVPPAESADKSTSGIKDDSKGHSSSSSNKTGENLVIPEKSSSFSIHPGRLCSDVCSYCFGKFGSLDTPCHIAQLKNVDRQQKILTAETHLTADSCLCDACYRHVDRKANCPSYNPSGNRKRCQRSGSSSHTQCSSTGCTEPAVHQVRRKWMVKLKRCIGKKVPVDMEKAALHQPFPLCSQHYFWVEHYMQCGLCKRRLSFNHMYLLGPEVHQLNQALANVSVPVALAEKIFVCKLCRYFCQLCLKYQDQQPLSSGNRLFCENYRKKILYQNEIEISDSDDKSENFLPPKSKRRKTKSAPPTSDGEGKSDKVDKGEKDRDSSLPLSSTNMPPVVTLDGGDGSNSMDSDYNRAGASTPTIDYSSLAYPGTSLDIITAPPVVLASSKQPPKMPRVRVKVGNTTLDPSTEIRPVFSPPTETHTSDQFQMQASFDFRSPYQAGSRKRKGDWEMCNATLQFTKETKKDFMNLQRPYGNYSSFIRHLVLLEKYWRSGDLTLSSGASARASSYISSVETRIKSLDGVTRTQSLSQSAPIPYVPPALPIVTPSVSVLPLPPLVPVASMPIALPPPPVAVIDLPLRRSSATTTTTSSLKPITISTVPANSAGSVVAAGTSSTTVTRINPKPSSRNKPLPNIIQVTTSSGKTYPVYKAFSLQQIKALQQQRKNQQQSLKQPQPPQQVVQTQSQLQPLASSISQSQNANSNVLMDKSNCDFTPLIGDVWSLAPDKATKLWDKSEIDIISETKASTPPLSSRQPPSSMSQPKVSVTILPKPPAQSKSTGRTSHLVNIAPKPVATAVMTSTGILLSRNSEISVSSVPIRRDDASKC